MLKGTRPCAPQGRRRHALDLGGRETRGYGNVVDDLGCTKSLSATELVQRSAALLLLVNRENDTRHVCDGHTCRRHLFWAWLQNYILLMPTCKEYLSETINTQFVCHFQIHLFIQENHQAVVKSRYLWETSRDTLEGTLLDLGNDCLPQYPLLSASIVEVPKRASSFDSFLHGRDGQLASRKEAAGTAEATGM